MLTNGEHQLNDSTLELTDEAVALSEALKAYNNKYRNYVMNHEHCSEEDFDTILKAFRQQLAFGRQSYLKSGESCFHGDTVEASFAELGRQIVCEESFESYPDSHITFESLVGFISRWQSYKDLIYKAFDNVDLGRGDDSFGDLIDALPLAGRKVINQILDNDVLSDKQLVRAVENAENLDPILYRVILNGENYFASRMEDGLEDFIRHLVCHRHEDLLEAAK